DALGQLVEGLATAHHRRRLARVGWATAIDPQPGGWAEGEPPPRPGNALTVLVDGSEALQAMADAIAGAQSHVYVTGWHITPTFALTRGERPSVLKELLAELTTRIPVRVLIWAGVPVPVMQPWRGKVRKGRDELTAGNQIQCALDARERPMHCHHEKTIVIDDRIAFVGGIDITSQSGDRFDSVHHPARNAIGWHDATARIEGPAVADVAEHFRMRWHEVNGERLAPVSPPERAGDVELQIVRTVPERVYAAVPRGDFRILESYTRAIRSAQRFIYLENQFLLSPETARLLREKLVNPPTPGFRVLMVLPSSPKSGNDDTRGVLAEVIDADGGTRHTLGLPPSARSGSRVDPIYVHAKVAIIDDRWLTLGSANL